MYKIIKNVYKIRLQRDCFSNLQQMGKVIRPFCWYQNIVPNGLSAPALGLYACIKTWKNMYKIRLPRDFFCNKWAKWQGLYVDITILSLMVPALGLYACIKSIKMCIKSDFKEMCLKRATNWQNDKSFLLASKYCPPKGCLPLPWGYIHH